MKTFTLLFSMLFILLAAFLLDTANAQLNTEKLFQAPFISAKNTHQSMQSLIQNAEKDIVFIENLGQIRDSKGNKRPDVLFITRSQCVDMYITSSGITYVFRKTEGDVRKFASMRKDKEVKDFRTSIYRLDMEFVGINKSINIKKELAIEQQFNYFTPEYPDGISPKGYKKITLLNIYEGIDLVYYEKEGKMKYDFIVKAGANPNNIKMKYKGASTVYLDKDGSAIVSTPLGEIREEKPHTYSRNTGSEIESIYMVRDNVISFEIANYNKSEDIIIDPYRIWATYYGGSGNDIGNNICTDNSGALYVTGTTTSTNFPTHTLPGAYNQTTISSVNWEDAFILKFNSNGVRLWATYYGGSHWDDGSSICTDNSGALYVTGQTHSTDFPFKTLPGAYNQTTYGGQFGDAFILKFSSSGARIWATYYGGNGLDIGYNICTDNTDYLYVTGRTNSTNFPIKTLAGVYNQTTSGGFEDAFILKFNSNGVRLWATYYGGNGGDYGCGICTDNSGDLYVTGFTGSTNFPIQTLPGAYNQTFGGYSDAFILRFNSSGARIWATYYGGSSREDGYGICTDNSSNLFVTGLTESTNFPTQTLSGAYNQTTYGDSSDAFILKFNDSGARLWATYYGGSLWDYGYDICIDTSGNLYVTGRTFSTNFPTQILPGAYNQTTVGGQYDAFILKFNSSVARLWATYYGGNSNEEGSSIFTDNSVNLYVTGRTYSTNFPIQTLTGAYNQTNYGGSGDAFVLKFNPTVGIKKISSEIPGNYSLYQNYPNPFNPTTNIKFDIPKASDVKLTIYDILGKEIAVLVNEKLNAGSYSVGWSAIGGGRNYSSGVYFYRLQSDKFSVTKRMMLIK